MASPGVPPDPSAPADVAGGGYTGTATPPSAGAAEPGAARPAVAGGPEAAAEAAAPLPPEAIRALEALLRDHATSVEFFQAVRLLERTHPDRTPVGGFGDPAAEVARFSVPPSIAFPASEIQSLTVDDEGPARMAVNFLGLTGPTGVLPHAYTLQVAERARLRDTALRDFLDLFHHRLVSLFYRAWEKYRFTVAHERARRDPLAAHVADLIGFGTEGLQGRLALRDESLLFYSGLLASHRRSAVGLEQLVSDYFGVPVTVEQFVGEWYPLATADQCALDDALESPSSRLGSGAVVGDEVWDPQAHVRLRLGPLTRTQYDDFLPGGSALARLRELVRVYADDQLDVEVQLVLRHDAVPPCRLGAEGPALPLGWATWLRTAPSAHDADDTVLSL
ncbi:MAG TPA: type VI secretion system baseplate subunit TssG [Gemmatimonadaceae bacterium]|nr:type VI secretion system baseplate subunit TssG [Gemmatimonadaceae bacterium]